MPSVPATPEHARGGVRPASATAQRTNGSANYSNSKPRPSSAAQPKSVAQGSPYSVFRQHREAQTNMSKFDMPHIALARAIAYTDRIAADLLAETAERADDAGRGDGGITAATNTNLRALGALLRSLQIKLSPMQQSATSIALDAAERENARLRDINELSLQLLSVEDREALVLRRQQMLLSPETPPSRTPLSSSQSSRRRIPPSSPYAESLPQPRTAPSSNAPAKAYTQCLAEVRALKKQLEIEVPAAREEGKRKYFKEMDDLRREIEELRGGGYRPAAGRAGGISELDALRVKNQELAATISALRRENAVLQSPLISKQEGSAAQQPPPQARRMQRQQSRGDRDYPFGGGATSDQPAEGAAGAAAPAATPDHAKTAPANDAQHRRRVVKIQSSGSRYMVHIRDQALEEDERFVQIVRQNDGRYTSTVGPK